MLPEAHQDLFVVFVAGIHRSGCQSGKTSKVEGSNAVGTFFTQQLKSGVKEKIVVASRIGTATRLVHMQGV